jgi:flagellar motor switch protein FliM
MNELTIELSSTLTRTTISLQDLLDLRLGDVVRVDVPETVTLTAGNVPLYHGTYGVSEGHRAIRITQMLVMGEAGPRSRPSPHS